MQTEESVARRLPQGRHASHALVLTPHEEKVLRKIVDSPTGIVESKGLTPTDRVAETRRKLLEKGLVVELTTRRRANQLAGPELLAAMRGEKPELLKLAHPSETKKRGRPSFLRLSPVHENLIRAALAKKKPN